MQNTPIDHTDIAIIGAGPVGLLLANLLGERGMRVRVVEERRDALRDSMAIGITPPSLSILKALDLDRTFIERGVSVTTVKVFENGNQQGTVDFSGIPADYRCMLSLPQSETVALLRENLKTFSSVRLQSGTRFVAQQQYGSSISYRLQNVETNALSEHTASFLVGCDGHRSAVRESAGIPFPGRSYRPQFCMADFEDRTGWAAEARLFFGKPGAVESFPLPDGRRRWIVQISEDIQPDDGNLSDAVAKRVSQRTGIDLSGTPAAFSSWFQPQRHLAATYARSRILLCGDAAHVMSPIGGQGMNTGFADARYLADVLSNVIDAPELCDRLLREYTRTRQRAFMMAANRAARGMWLGTRTGSFLSLVRRVLMRRILLRPPVRDRLASSFAMLTTPGSEVPHVT